MSGTYVVSLRELLIRVAYIWTILAECPRTSFDISSKQKTDSKNAHHKQIIRLITISFEHWFELNYSQRIKFIIERDLKQFPHWLVNALNIAKRIKFSPHFEHRHASLDYTCFSQLVGFEPTGSKPVSRKPSLRM